VAFSQSPILIWLATHPLQYNFFNDLFYLDIVSKPINSVIDYILVQEVRNGFFTPVRFVLESSIYFVAQKNANLLYLFNTLIAAGIIWGFYKVFFSYNSISTKLNFLCVFLLFIYLWPWTHALFVYPGTVEKYLLLFLIFNYYVFSKNFTKAPNLLYIYKSENISSTLGIASRVFKSRYILSFIFLMLALLLRYQFLTFIPGLLYLATKNNFFQKRISYVISTCISLLSLFLTFLLYKGSYSGTIFSIDAISSDVRSSADKFILLTIMTIITGLHFYKSFFGSDIDRNDILKLNSLYLFLLFYSLGLIVWGNLGYHLSIVGVLISTYLVVYFTNLISNLSKFFIYAIFLSSVLFHSFISIYILSAQSSMDRLLFDFLKPKVFSVDSNPTFVLNCFEASERFGDLLELNGIEKGGLNFVLFDKDYVKNFYLIANETSCPEPKSLEGSPRRVIYDSRSLNPYYVKYFY
jgi:hypothetical protein